MPSCSSDPRAIKIQIHALAITANSDNTHRKIPSARPNPPPEGGKSKMPRCARKGCGKEYDKDVNGEESCSYHPGEPVRTFVLPPPASPDIYSRPMPHHSRFFMKGSNLGHAATS